MAPTKPAGSHAPKGRAQCAPRRGRACAYFDHRRNRPIEKWTHFSGTCSCVRPVKAASLLHDMARLAAAAARTTTARIANIAGVMQLAQLGRRRAIGSGRRRRRIGGTERRRCHGNAGKGYASGGLRVTAPSQKSRNAGYGDRGCCQKAHNRSSNARDDEETRRWFDLFPRRRRSPRPKMKRAASCARDCPPLGPSR